MPVKKATLVVNFASSDRTKRFVERLNVGAWLTYRTSKVSVLVRLFCPPLVMLPELTRTNLIKLVPEILVPT